MFLNWLFVVFGTHLTLCRFTDFRTIFGTKNRSKPPNLPQASEPDYSPKNAVGLCWPTTIWVLGTQLLIQILRLGPFQVTDIPHRPQRARHLLGFGYPHSPKRGYPRKNCQRRRNKRYSQNQKGET